MRLGLFTDRQSRMDTAFSQGGSCCSVYCEACCRCYFVTSAGHGDYEPGELDRLHELAKEDSDKYVEVPDFSSVATMTRPTDGKHVVVGCLCDPTEDLAEFLEENAEEFTVYLREYWKARRTEAARRIRTAADALAAIGWSEMGCAPKDATWIEVETIDGTICAAHWASDLSGEEQPPFQGWFTGEQDKALPLRQINPIHWRPLAAGRGSEGNA